MLRNKRILLVFAVVIALFLIPNVINATDTFNAENGIVAKKIVNSTGGNVEIHFSNINLNEEYNYTWGIGRNTNELDVEEWYTLGDFSESNKSAVITLTTSENKIKKVLRETNTAWLYIKDNTNNIFVVKALKVDLTLPLLKAFDITENPNSSTFRSFHIRNIYDIDNLYYNIQKITNEETINNYIDAKMNGKDLSTITSLATKEDAPQENWKVMDENYTAINDYYIHKKPTDPGIYYVWIKGKETDSKLIYGYTIFGLDNESPIVSSIRVNSPISGTYKTGEKIKIRIIFNEIITGTYTPILKVKFGDSAERSLENGTIKENYVEYEYTIQESDKGQLATVNVTGGTIKDSYNNNAKLYCPIITGNIIKANIEQLPGISNEPTQTNEQNNPNVANNPDTPSAVTKNTKDNIPKDSTIKKDSKLPQTGATAMLLLLFAIVAVATVSKIKCKQFKDI